MKSLRSKSLLRTLPLIFCLLYVIKIILLPNTALAWWDASFTNRIKITFSGATTTEDQVNFPVLINLNPGRVNYGNIQDLGQDIRFVDSDDATALNYEIEKYDETDTSTIWVKVPQVASTTTDFIYYVLQ